MEFLKWLGGIVVFVWLITLLLNVGGNLIHLLLIVAAIIFILDYASKKKR